MNLQEILLAYGEWLDSEGVIVSDQDGDPRTHDDLAAAFIREHESGAYPLAARVRALQQTTED